jgi:transposase
MDQLCVNQEDREEVSKQISELGQYYNNASVTLVAIQTKFSKNNCCNGESERIADKESALRKIVNSEWFSRP